MFWEHCASLTFTFLGEKIILTKGVRHLLVKITPIFTLISPITVRFQKLTSNYAAQARKDMAKSDVGEIVNITKPIGSLGNPKKSSKKSRFLCFLI